MDREEYKKIMLKKGYTIEEIEESIAEIEQFDDEESKKVAYGLADSHAVVFDRNFIEKE